MDSKYHSTSKYLDNLNHVQRYLSVRIKKRVTLANRVRSVWTFKDNIYECGMLILNVRRGNLVATHKSLGFIVPIK